MEQQTGEENHIYGVIHLYDGEYYSKHHEWDAWAIVIDRPLNPHDAIAIENRLISAYTENKRVKVRELLIKLLKEHGYREMNSIGINLDYSGFERSP